MTGGRRFCEPGYIWHFMDGLLRERGPFSCVVHGDADGLDTEVDAWAKARGIPVEPCAADWDGLKRKAGKRRNSTMLADHRPTICVVFPGGTGTADMLEKAHRAGVRVVKAQGLIEVASEVPLGDL